MTESNLSALNNGLADLIRMKVLVPVSNHLAATKGISVSVDELATVLNLPSHSQPVVPSMAFGGAMVPSMTVSTSTTARSRAGASSSEVQVPGQCKYQFKRGKDKGRFCGKAVNPENPASGYCKSCYTTREGVKKEIAASGLGGGAVPTMGGVAPGFPSAAASRGSSTESGTLNVKAFRDDLYISDERWLVKQLPSGPIAVVGRHDLATDTVVPLTPEELAQARNMGLILPPSPKAVESAAVSTSLTSASTSLTSASTSLTSALPVVPTTTSVGVSSLSGGLVSALPVVATISSGGAPSIPSLPTLSSVMQSSAH